MSHEAHTAHPVERVAVERSEGRRAAAEGQNAISADGQSLLP